MYPTLFTNAGVKKFAEEIDQERGRQLAKFGEQHHPDVEPRDIPVVTHHYYASRADIWKQVNAERATPTNSGRCVAFCADKNTEPHTHTAWDGILLEEVYEALAEADPAKLRTELLQVAAVCAAWIRDLDSRATAGAQPATTGADRIVAYRNTDRPGVLLCQEHGNGWVGLTPLTSEDLPDGGFCTWGEPGKQVCGRDLLIAPPTA